VAGRAAAVVAGRGDRVARSKRAICDACLDLIQEGVLQPSADQIADRAGLSRRSIFNQFRDLAELYDAVVEVGMQRCAPLLEPVPSELALGERIAMLVDARARFFDATTAFARALTAQALVGAAREQAWRVARAQLAAQAADVERVFGAELDRLAGAERADCLEALAGAASAAHWEYLRRSRGLSPARARAVVVRSLRAQLAAIGAAAGREVPGAR